jgi:hypothetical protein
LIWQWYRERKLGAAVVMGDNEAERMLLTFEE